MRKPAAIVIAAFIAALAAAPAAQASSSANTAALQVALKALRHYSGSIDGLAESPESNERRHVPVPGELPPWKGAHP